MIVKTFDTHTLLEDERDDVKDFASYLSHKIPRSFSKKHILLDLLKYEKLTLEELLLFMEVSTAHKETAHSFVIINNAIDPDLFPDALVVVPTIQEGEDVLGMEAIERDLGF